MTNSWQRVRLADTCDLIAGFAFKSKDFGNYFEKVIKITNIEPPFVNMKDLQGVDLSMYNKDKLQKYIAKKGDYVFAMTGATIGKLGKICDGEAYINQRVLMFKPKKDIDKKFLFYILSQKNFYQYVINHIDSESAQANISANSIGNYEFNIPPLDVQKRIAGVLSVLDDKIELNNKINQNLDLQAQSLFNEIYNSSENGVLSDIVDIVESGNRPKGGACPSGIPSIGAENIEKFGVYDFSKEKFISEEFFDNMKRGKVQSGDVLLYKDGAYTGKVSMALDGFPHKKCALNEHVFLLRANDKCSQFFLYYCLSCDKNKTYLHNLACAKAAQPGLNQQELLGMPIFIPEYDKIEKFTDIVNPLMHKIAQNALENIKLSAIRDALLPKLMSGEIDVENIPVSAIIPNE